MDELKKFLARLVRKRQERVVGTIERIERGDLEGLDILPLKGHAGHFRCRLGDIRILFFRKDNRHFVYAAGFRGDIY